MHCVTPTHSFAQAGKVAAAVPAAAEGGITRFVASRATSVKAPRTSGNSGYDDTKARLALQFRSRNGKSLYVTLGGVLSYDK